MSKIDLSTTELFMRLGATPATRSARADSLFRRLRQATEDVDAEAILRRMRELRLTPQDEAA